MATALTSQRRASGGCGLLGAALSFFILGITGGIAEPSSPLTDELPNLFVQAMEREDACALTEPSVVRTRAVRANVDLIAPVPSGRLERLRLNLFDDVSLVAVFERSEVRSPSSYTWFGRLADEQFSSCILVVERGVMAARIRAPGKGVYEVGFLGAGVHIIRQIDESKFPRCGVGDAVRMGSGVPGVPIPCGGPTSTCVDDGSQIDVLVVYTQAARVGAGGTAAINASIQLAIDTTNDVYTNSLINTQLNLVLAAEIDYDESAPFPLEVLKNPNDGIMDEVHALRDEVRADLVSLILEDFLGGRAQLMRYIQPVENFGFSVLGRPFLSAFTHELGHNMGCAHERVGTNEGYFEYSFGYSFVGDSGQTWGTQMGPGLRIPYFSNPNVLFDGQPTGIPAAEPDSADNARTINETALIIANIRSSVPPDCNENGVGDDEDIATETSDDENSNGIPDECELTLHVDAGAPPGGDGTNWASAYNDLQDAIVDAACPCNPVSEIWVAAGTYRPDRGSGNRKADFNPLNIAIYGGFAGNEDTVAQRAGLFEQTILSGDLDNDDGPGFQNNDENSYTVVQSIGTDMGAVLDGFTITAGNANGDEPGLPIESGGGVFIGSAGLTLRNCHIIGNRAIFGGGIRPHDAAATLVNCAISENTADRGGGMFGSGTQRLINCEFTDNSANVGGGLYVQSGTALLANCVFGGNSSNAGGGLYFQLGGTGLLANCVLSGNTSNFGAALYIAQSESTVINSTFSMNAAAISGGGAYLIQGSALTVRNSVLWNNTDTAGASSDETAQIFDDPSFGLNEVSVEHSCVQDDDPDDANVYPGTGNIDNDPLFVTSLTGDYRLRHGSPAIDAGENQAMPADTADLDTDGDITEPVPFDLDDNARFDDDIGTPDTGEGTPPIVDMGAFEFPETTGDMDGDGDVDLNDHAIFANCLAGPDVRTSPKTCTAPQFDSADLTGDGDVDLHDFSRLVHSIAP